MSENKPCKCYDYFDEEDLQIFLHSPMVALGLAPMRPEGKMVRQCTYSMDAPCGCPRCTGCKLHD